MIIVNITISTVVLVAWFYGLSFLKPKVSRQERRIVADRRSVR